MSDYVVISFKIHKSKLVLIDAVCRRLRISRSEFIRTAILRYINNIDKEKKFRVCEVVLK